MRQLQSAYPFYFLLLITIGLAGCSGSIAGGERVLASYGQMPGEEHQGRYTRYNINSEQGQKALASFEKAMAAMRQMDCSNPLSWYYQSGIHQVPESFPSGKNRLCDSYQNGSPIKTAWSNCTHQGIGEQVHFLIWHRMYLYHFEKIVRKISGDKDFSLPYWAYCDTVNVAQNRIMPAAFRKPGSSLYEKARRSALNAGQPIAQVRGDEFLSLKTLFQYTRYETFNENFDQSPHGAMHVYIGDMTERNVVNQINQKMGEGLMGGTETAAFDPVFWVHHANLDRLWQQWSNSPLGAAPVVDSLKAHDWSYHFFDENGNDVVYSIDSVMKVLYSLDYDYDDTRLQAPVTAKQQDTSVEIVTAYRHFTDTLAHHKPNAKVKGTTTFSMENIGARMVTSAPGSGPDKAMYKMKVKVCFAKAPKSNYQVYLNLPKGAVATPESEYFIGFMNFFGADHAHRLESQLCKTDKSKIHKTFTYEITAPTREKRVLLESKLDVTIVKSDGSPEDEITVESVSITKD